MSRSKIVAEPHEGEDRAESGEKRSDYCQKQLSYQTPLSFLVVQLVNQELGENDECGEDEDTGDSHEVLGVDGRDVGFVLGVDEEVVSGGAGAFDVV